MIVSGIANDWEDHVQSRLWVYRLSDEAEKIQDEHDEVFKKAHAYHCRLNLSNHPLCVIFCTTPIPIGKLNPQAFTRVPLESSVTLPRADLAAIL